MHCFTTRLPCTTLLLSALLLLVCAGLCAHGVPHFPSLAGLLADRTSSGGEIPDWEQMPNPGSPADDGDWDFSGDNIYRLVGNVGIGTDSPVSLLDVQSTEDTHGIRSSVPWIAVWAHRASTTGTWPAIHGECDSEAGGGSAVRGIMTSTSPGSSSAGVRGINNGTGAAGIGVYGSQDGSGYGVYGYTPDGRGVYGSSSSGTGVWGSGGLQGGYFADSDNSGYARVGYSNHGIEAYGTDAGGYFADSDGTGDALVGDGDNGISAYGTHAGGLFKDTDNTGFTYVAYGDYGISAWGAGAGGYFRDTDSDGKAYVGYGTRGIEASGPGAGGYFEDTDSSAWAAVGSSAYKVVGSGTVSFVQNHPDDADKVIVYACPEGDEVATYTRGTARLVDGVACVPLGETFKWVTNPDIGLTAHLTPRGNCEGLYVESLTTAEMVVRELRSGRSDVTFDYIVYGLRIGFEEVSIVQEKEREAYIPSMADHRERYVEYPELRWYNSLERFKRMRAATGETWPLDLSASQWLRDAIVEFDPAIHGIDLPVQ